VRISGPVGDRHCLGHTHRFPVLAAVTIGHLSLGLLNRTTPQLGLSNIGFSVALLAGAGALYLVAPPRALMAAEARARPSSVIEGAMAETQREDQTEQASQATAAAGSRRRQPSRQPRYPPCGGAGGRLAALTAVGPALRDSLVNMVWAAADGLPQGHAGNALLPLLSTPPVHCVGCGHFRRPGRRGPFGCADPLGHLGSARHADFSRCFSGTRLGPALPQRDVGRSLSSPASRP